MGKAMNHNRKLSVIGLGYVGLPVAVAFGKRQRVVGFDIDPRRIEDLRAGVDRTREVTTADLRRSDIVFSSDPAQLEAADFHIVAVPSESSRPYTRASRLRNGGQAA